MNKKPLGQIVGYARVSTIDQNLEVQLEQLTSAGCTKIFGEKKSGKGKGANSRPELEKALEYVREGDTFIITKIDRMARNLRDLLSIVDTLQDKGVRLCILASDIDVTGTMGKAFLQMLGVFAEFERELMLERQREGIERAKAEGRSGGRPATAKKNSSDILRLAEQGMTKKAIAEQLGIGVASVYRILKDGSVLDEKSLKKGPSLPYNPRQAKVGHGC